MGRWTAEAQLRYADEPGYVPDLEAQPFCNPQVGGPVKRRARCGSRGMRLRRRRLDVGRERESGRAAGCSGHAGLGSGSDAGGLLGALGGALSEPSGRAEAGPALAAIPAVPGKLNLSPSVIATVAPLALQFLEQRLPPELLDKVKSVAPFLTGGGAGGALGSLLGR